MHRVRVGLSHASYNILVGAGLFADLDRHVRDAGLRAPDLVISQPRIFRAVGHSIRKEYPVAMIPDGERAKTLASVQRLINRMVALRLTRQSTIVALGGGVVGDVAGFVGSIYMRGISVVQVPTTLLAQVDSSIGGKTGVNHRVAKNLIGTFHQPSLVVSDPLLLKKLPEREYTGGLYEALKYGVIRDSRLFNDLANHLPRVLERDPDHVERLVAACAAIKADVVMADERESDLRRILNFGHTVGHAIEAAGKYYRIKHGEAVRCGMIAATRISYQLGKIPEGQAIRIQTVTESIGPGPPLLGLTMRAILSALQHDKKTRDGAVHFVLPTRIGRVEITPDVPLNLVREVVRGMLDEARRQR